MKTKTTAAELLNFIKARIHASENDVMHQFNPEPAFPIGGDEAAPCGLAQGAREMDG